MMQSAKDWFAYNLAVFLNWPVFGRVFLKQHMRSADIVILEDVFVQNIMQMFFVENNHSKIATINEVFVLHKSFKLTKFEFLSRTAAFK
jgi:hypothetical protein